MLGLLPSLAIPVPPPSPRRSPSPKLPSTPPPPALSLADTNAPLTTSFSRYSIILSRMPFGDEAAAAAAAAALAEAKIVPVESFTKTLKMCAITRNHFTGTVQVGLVDSATKKSYFLSEGDSEDGMELKVADYVGEKALLKKGAEEVWMTMTEVKTPQAVVGPGGAVAMTPSPFTRSKVEPAAPTLPESAAKPRLTGETLKKHLQSYQMDLIRAGGSKGPPLPMALTPEMDEQLVKEGVLPPTTE